MEDRTLQALQRLERLLQSAKTLLKEADTHIRTDIMQDSPLAPHAPSAVGFLMCAVSHIDAALLPLSATAVLSHFARPRADPIPPQTSDADPLPPV